jgi:hypothetical protein
MTAPPPAPASSWSWVPSFARSAVQETAGVVDAGAHDVASGFDGARHALASAGDDSVADEEEVRWLRTIGPDARADAIDNVLEQDPDGMPNTNGRSGAIHRGVMPDELGGSGYIGTAPAQDGGDPLDEVKSF